jgi:hypothetical protein
MSIGAMVYRAFNLGLIDETEMSGLFQNMGRRRWRGPLREPFDSQHDMPVERPRMLRRAIEAMLNEGTTGRQTILNALPLPQIEIERLTGVDKGSLCSDPETPFTVPRRPFVNLRTVDLETGTILEFPQHRKTEKMA